MDLDFNIKGKQYGFMASKLRNEGYSILGEKPEQMLANLRARQAIDFRNSDKNGKNWILDAAGCLDRLNAFLFQVSRVASHAESLTRKNLPGQPNNDQPKAGQMVMIAADEACFDFESLLFHARAGLDRLTWFVAARHGQRCDRFSRLQNILSDFCSKDDRARQMLEVLKEASRFGGILIDENNDKALRSLVAHRTSIPEGRETAFTIHFLKNGKRLIFDCEALKQPLLLTSYELSRDVPFVVQNAVAIYMGLNTLPISVFKATWVNPTAVFSDHISENESDPRFSVAGTNPDGIQLRTRHLVSSVLDYAFMPKESV
jgi:hypothetical protein